MYSVMLQYVNESLAPPVSTEAYLLINILRIQQFLCINSKISNNCNSFLIKFCFRNIILAEVFFKVYLNEKLLSFAFCQHLY